MLRIGPRWRRQLISSTIALAATTWACAYRTRPAEFGPAGVDQASIASILAYAGSLRFNSVLGAADSQRLAIRTPAGLSFGPLAKIEPEEGSHRLRDGELAEGRVIARIWSESAYSKLGLGPGWTYWWVDRQGRGGTWRSVFVAADLNTRHVDSLEITEHGSGYRWRQAIARFIWRDSDDGSWGTCGSNRCCSSGPRQ